MSEWILALWPILAQTVILVIAIAASFFRTRERIVVLETNSKHTEYTLGRMVEKVDGLSRAVARQEGENQH